MTRTADLHPTVGTLIDRGTTRLAAAGLEGPRAEALGLWRALFEADLGRPELGWGESVPGPAVSRYEAALAARAAGVPMAYVVEKTGFRHLELFVDRRVLIPRPETEGLVQLALDWARSESRWGPVTDVGTGSGCIALSMATEGRFERVVATDLSEDALDVARRNLDAIRPPTPVEVRLGDLTAPLEAGRYDVLISNPPYIAPEEWPAVDPSVSEYEPRGALVSPNGGMNHIRRILDDARRCMRPGGLMALEIDARRGAQTLAAARGQGWLNAEVRRDLFGRDRYLVATAEG